MAGKKKGVILMAGKKIFYFALVLVVLWSGPVEAKTGKKGLKNKAPCASGLLCSLKKTSDKVKKLLVQYNGSANKIMERGIAVSRQNTEASERIWDIRDLLENLQDATWVLNSYLSMAPWIAREHECAYAGFLINRYRIYEKSYSAHLELISRTVADLHDPGALGLVREARQALAQCKGELDAAYGDLMTRDEACKGRKPKR